jgi:transcriptional regulator with GAF, ATPase, and Fis domain
MSTSPLESSASGFPRDNLHQNKLSRLLPDLNHLLLTHADIREAFPRICRRLHRALAHQHAAIALFEPDSARFRLYVEHSPRGGSLPASLQLPLEKTPYGEVFRSRRPVVVDDLRSPRFACDATQELLKSGRRSGCWVPLQTADHVLGALSVSAGRPGVYRSDDAYLLNEVGGQISLALANQLGLEQVQKLRRQLDEQIHDWNLNFRDIAATAACGVVQWGKGGIVSDANDVFLHMVGRTREDIREGLNCSDLTPGGKYFDRQVHAEEEFSDHGSFEPFRQEYQRPDGTRVLVLVSSAVLNQRRPPWLALVVDLGGRVPAGKCGTVPLPLPSGGNEMLAANSPGMRQILREVEQVAPTDTSVLLLGETGTGKEVIAHAICEMSRRRHEPFVKVNCAAIPAGLLESELFGYEKGGYAGARCAKIGGIELAHHGTLFLDEVGDIPLELQPKLLRALQAQEFERLGGTETIKVDIRVIMATNRNLAEMVLASEFRRDLFYHLSVFPVRVPPLRERPESIPTLAHYFVRKFSRRLNRPPLSIPASTMGRLERWQWPGNVRELENLIERAVMLSPGSELRINLEELHTRSPEPLPGLHTLRDIEREHIARILHDTKGVVGGIHGAASILGVKRTTLQYKMKKLEIPRR